MEEDSLATVLYAIAKKKSTAIVGPHGAGKTKLVEQVQEEQMLIEQDLSATTSRDPRHFDRIEGGRNCVPDVWCHNSVY